MYCIYTIMWPITMCFCTIAPKECIYTVLPPVLSPLTNVFVNYKKPGKVECWNNIEKYFNLDQAWTIKWSQAHYLCHPTTAYLHYRSETFLTSAMPGFKLQYVAWINILNPFRNCFNFPESNWVVMGCPAIKNVLV